MVKLRLARFGRKDLPVYRIVAVDSRKKRDGAYIDQVGTYSPTKNEVKVNEEKALYWLSNGAQPSTTVKSILSNEGIWSKFMGGKTKATT